VPEGVVEPSEASIEAATSLELLQEADLQDQPEHDVLLGVATSELQAREASGPEAPDLQSEGCGLEAASEVLDGAEVGAGDVRERQSQAFASWLLDVDHSGSLSVYAETLEESYDTIDQILRLYTLEEGGLDTTFFDDARVSDLTHQQHFSDWFSSHARSKLTSKACSAPIPSSAIGDESPHVTMAPQMDAVEARATPAPCVVESLPVGGPRPHGRSGTRQLHGQPQATAESARVRGLLQVGSSGRPQHPQSRKLQLGVPVGIQMRGDSLRAPGSLLTGICGMRDRQLGQTLLGLLEASRLTATESRGCPLKLVMRRRQQPLKLQRKHQRLHHRMPSMTTHRHQRSRDETPSGKCWAPLAFLWGGHRKDGDARGRRLRSEPPKASSQNLGEIVFPKPP